MLRKEKCMDAYGINTVLNIGANVGQFVETIRRAVPQAMMYSFEPLKECYA